MPNENKIKGRIKELGLTIGKIATEMGLSAYTLGRKISGKTPMTLSEASKLMEILKIPESEFSIYFFTPKVA